MRVLELYCGIGGCAAALDAAASVVAAVDIDRSALAVYRANFDHPLVPAEIETLDLAAYPADLWWLSPPCRPFTRRGAGRDVDDPRCRSFLSLLTALQRLRPNAVALENVPPFADSRAAQQLRHALHTGGYHIAEQILCPTQMGLPMRRRRYYLLASLQPVALPELAPSPLTPLIQFLDPADDEGAASVPERWLDQYRQAIDVVAPESPDAVAACFTSAYGRSPVRSGSYLRQGGRVRFFSPREIARLLGFPAAFRLPARHRTAYRLLGNSLAVPVVRHVLRQLANQPASAVDVARRAEPPFR